MEISSAAENGDLSVTYSVVIPVYNSERTLKRLHRELTDVFSTIPVTYEIVLVDDASRDKSWEVMKELRASDDRVKIIQHMRNFGQHPATLCGMRYARGEFVITMDDDLQHPPKEIAKLIEAIRNDDGADVVIGTYESKKHSLFRNVASRTVNSVVSYVFQKDPNLKLTSFRILRRSVAVELVKDRSFNPRIGLLMLGITNHISNTKVEHHPRAEGRSGYSVRHLVTDTLETILSQSAFPLQFASYFGFACTIFSFILTVYYLALYMFRGTPVPGWTTVVLLILFFSGSLLFAIGIIGEYLIRILREVKSSSTSVVRHKDL